MCKTNACGCGGGSPFPVGLAVVLLALAAAVSALASLLLHLLVVLVAAAGVVALAGVAYVAWRVRVLTRPAIRVAGSVRTSKREALPVGSSPLAIEAPKRWYATTPEMNTAWAAKQMSAGMTEPGEVAGEKRRAAHP